MGERNQREARQIGRAQRVGQGAQRRGKQGRVQRIIGGRAPTRTARKGREGEVGGEKQQREPAPAEARAPVSQQREGEEGDALGAQRPANGAIDDARRVGPGQRREGGGRAWDGEGHGSLRKQSGDRLYLAQRDL